MFSSSKFVIKSKSPTGLIDPTPSSSKTSVSTSENEENLLPPSKKLKIEMTFVDPITNTKVQKAFFKPDYFEIEDLEECSPICSQNELPPTTRFPWSTVAPSATVVEEKWIPPTKNSINELIFNKVKQHLKWTGEDKFMKSSDEMKKLLRSGKVLNVTRVWTVKDKVTSNKETKSKEIDVKLSNGRISFKENRASICSNSNCWKSSKQGGFCDEHSAGNVTHFLIKDSANPVSTYAFMSSEVHSPLPKNPPTVEKMLNGEATRLASEKKYVQERTKDGYPPKWVVIKKWVAKDLDKSDLFEQTIRTFLSILFFFLNSNNPSQKFVLIKNQVYIEKADLPTVKEMLQNCGVELELADPSDYATDSESPFLKIQNLKRSVGDRWIYTKFGTIGKLYVGKVTQDNKIPTSFIHPRHLLNDPDARGIPLFQSQEDNNEANQNETDMMEGLGQMAVLVCEMLGAKVDGALIYADFKKIENFSDWTDIHLERMKKLVAFFSEEKLGLKVPESFDMSLMNWKPVEVIGL